MLKIYLARHGQDEDNANGILNGRRDSSLTEKGVAQASDVAALIKENSLTFDDIYCSPLKRARKTAEIIAEATGNPEPIVEDLLIERDFGIMTGEPAASIVERCAPDIVRTETVTYFLSPRGAETFPELIERSHRVLKKIGECYREGRILLVTHGDIGKMIYAAYYGLDWMDVLKKFHFGNSELLELSEESDADETHIFRTTQHNH